MQLSPSSLLGGIRFKTALILGAKEKQFKDAYIFDRYNCNEIINVIHFTGFDVMADRCIRHRNQKSSNTHNSEESPHIVDSTVKSVNK